MRWFQPKTLIATAGAVILPLGGAGLPGLDPGPGLGRRRSCSRWPSWSPAWSCSRLLLARLIEQMNAGRVGRWLETPEGREWLESLPEEEREAFQERFEDFR